METTDSEQCHLNAYNTEEADDMIDSSVAAALTFVNNCNAVQGYGGTSYTQDEDGKFHRVITELPALQEAAFGHACRMLGQYFIEHTRKKGKDV